MSFRWGIIGSGGIARAMTETLEEIEDAEVVAVVSPTDGRADAFGEEYGIDLRFEHPSDLAGNVDVAYVGSANHRHFHDTMALIDVGIPTLCEKSLALDADQAQLMADHARANNVFLMEAMWMRFQPFWNELVSRIGDGAVGKVNTISARFDISANPDPTRRWMDPNQGGGALLDVAIYPITFAHSLAGDPTSIDASGALTESGVDGTIQATMTHPGGVTSMTSGSIMSKRSVVATVVGSHGRIEVADPFHHPPGFTVYRDGAVVEQVDTTYPGSGYRPEVEEVHRCLENGLVESSIRPLDDTMAVMRIIDEVRRSAFG